MTARQTPTVELVKPQISELMTYEVYAKLRRWKTDTLPPEERGIKGVEVEYKATVKERPPGRPFHTSDAAQGRFRNDGSNSV